jgi:hypothetical protein
MIAKARRQAIGALPDQPSASAPMRRDCVRGTIVGPKGDDMATIPHEHPLSVGKRSVWLDARDLWTALTIVTIWLAVLFVGVFGPDFVSVGNGSTTTIPSGIGVAFFALFATMAVAKYGFSRERRQ